jgi:hypothetical protein
MSANGRHNADSALVAAIAAGLTYTEAGKTAGVSERTVRRRMADERFRSQVEAARTEFVSRAVGRAADSVVEAVETLRTLMDSADGESVRLGAARALLQFVNHRRADPVAEAIHGATSISRTDFVEILGRIIDAALEKILPEEHEAFLHQIAAMAPKSV